MKIIFIFLTLCLTTACTAKSTKQSNERIDIEKCDKELKMIVRSNLNLNNIKDKDISFNDIDDNDNEEILQVFVSSDGANNGNVLGSIKINKTDEKIYDITNDEDNKKPMKLDEKKSFFKECVR